MRDPNDPSLKDSDLDGECDLVFNSNESIGDENEPHSTSNGDQERKREAPIGDKRPLKINNFFGPSA